MCMADKYQLILTSPRVQPEAQPWKVNSTRVKIEVERRHE